MNQTFQDAAALGVTVFAASGDSGSDCGQGDGAAHVLYPASDPFVSSCGGTRISDVYGALFTETTWAQSFGTTGGGISDFFWLPNDQIGAGVPLSANDSHQGRRHSGHRGERRIRRAATTSSSTARASRVSAGRARRLRCMQRWSR